MGGACPSLSRHERKVTHSAREHTQVKHQLQFAQLQLPECSAAAADVQVSVRTQRDGQRVDRPGQEARQRL